LTEKRNAYWVSHLSREFRDYPAEETLPGCGPDFYFTLLTGQTSCDSCAGLAFIPALQMCSACAYGGSLLFNEENIASATPPGVLCPKTTAVKAPGDVAFTKAEGKFCAGNNMPTSGDKNQCFSKCGAGCKGNSCFCGGLLQGYDGPDSDALCLDEETCLEVCASKEDCVGIDMHSTLPRCFLNLKASSPSGAEESCEFYVDYGKLTTDPDYSYMYKQAELGRRLGGVGVDPSSDLAKSWEAIGAQVKAASPAPAEGRRLAGDDLSMLRFEGLKFPTGAQYKACFCDVDTLGAGKYCKKAADYKIEIGTIHVSGVSCLVENKKFQRGTCVAQGVGGLRCYPGAAPKYVVPEAPAPVAPAVTVEDEVFDIVKTTFCLYGPEEETSDDPFCA
jgi:hypothetical protein